MSDPAEATAQPERGVSLTTTSSPLIDSSAPSRVTVAGPARYAATNAATSTARIGVGDLLGLLAEPLAERPVVGLHRDLDQLVGVTQLGQGLNVELGPDLVPQRLGQRRPARRRYQRPGQRLPVLHLGLGPRRPAELDQSPDEVHLLGQDRVDQRGVRLRPGGQVHRVSRPGAGEQRAPHPLGDERHERREHPGQHVEHGVQRGQRGGVAVPEPAAGATDVPVRQVVDKPGQGTARLRGVERVERGADLAGHPVHLGQGPPVQRGRLAGRGRPAPSRCCGRTGTGRRRPTSTSAPPWRRSPPGPGARSGGPTRASRRTA